MISDNSRTEAEISSGIKDKTKYDYLDTFYIRTSLITKYALIIVKRAFLPEQILFLLKKPYRNTDDTMRFNAENPIICAFLITKNHIKYAILS